MASLALCTQRTNCRNFEIDWEIKAQVAMKEAKVLHFQALLVLKINMI